MTWTRSSALRDARTFSASLFASAKREPARMLKELSITNSTSFPPTKARGGR
jgi:hypothetical protein